MSETHIVGRAAAAAAMIPLALLGPSRVFAGAHAGAPSTARMQPATCTDQGCNGGSQYCFTITFPDGSAITCYKN